MLEMPDALAYVLYLSSMFVLSTVDYKYDRILLERLELVSASRFPPRPSCSVEKGAIVHASHTRVRRRAWHLPNDHTYRSRGSRYQDRQDY